MEDFFKQIAKYLCITAILLCMVEMVIRSIPNSCKHKLEIIENNRDCVEVMILGSSHSHRGINPLCFHQKTINMANGGQGITIDAFLLDKYINRLPKLKYIILPIDYQTLYMFDAYGFDANYMYNNVYYGFEPKIFSTDNYEIFHPNSIQMKLDSLFWGVGDYYQEDDLGFTSDKKKSIEGAEETLQWQTVTNFDNDTIKKNIAAFERIAKIALENDLFLVVVTIPTHYSFYEIANKAQECFTKKVIDSVANMSDKFVYFDYFKMSLDDDDFWDATHLNTFGAEKFSRILAHKIDSLEFLKVGE